MEVNDQDRQDRMQRIRVGLTGLAVVLLLVLLATAVLKRVGPADGHSAADNALAAANEAANQDEPLADLGMVPGAPENANDEANAAANAQDVP